jgi:V8-like Glu-specific endopeptidase
MTARARETARPGGRHTRVSNHDQEAAAARKRVADPPSDGANGETALVTGEGTEAVEGYSREETAPAEAWSPPQNELRDIGEASFGRPPPMAEVVIGPDDRVQITNTSSYPWRAHASLVIQAADNSSWIGTGWFIGPRTLMTAGHVVHIKNSGVPGRDGWVKKINVMPGRNGNTLPYGSVTSTEFHSVTGWTQDGSEDYDYGAIIIPTNVGDTVGRFSFGVYSNADLTSIAGNISGYPGDKPQGTQWYDWSNIARVTSRKVYYEIDTAGGQSGSAVYRIVNGERYAIGIHAYGDVAGNSATRITTPVFNNMVAWNS